MEQPLTSAEVGRDYERYIGYLYESAGWQVVFRGILRGVADRGRDLVCWNDKAIHIVQCKRWSANRPVDGSVVQQLIDTTSEYARRKHGEDQLVFDLPIIGARWICPVLFTTTSLLPDALELARQHKVRFRERYLMRSYPKIKCYHTRTGERLYLTPVCYSYDSVSINYHKGDFYVHTEGEALKHGFQKHEERAVLFAAAKRVPNAAMVVEDDRRSPSIVSRFKTWFFGFRHRI